MKTGRERRLFLKGLSGFTRRDNLITEEEARATAYYWWWLFMRLSPVLWYATQTGRKPSDPLIADTLKKIGNIFESDFYDWWESTGKIVFSEAVHPAELRLIDLEQQERIELYEKSVIVEIPLTIRKETIIKKLKELLATPQDDGKPLHAGRGLNVAKTSTAELRLHTKRFNPITLRREYFVMIYRLLYPHVKIWCIGDRLQLSAAHKVRGKNRYDFTSHRDNPFSLLHSLTGRYLYKAERAILNAERGSFPKFDKVALPVDHMPFGKKWNKDYQAAIANTSDEPSLWRTWLHDEFGSDLMKHIAEVNGQKRAFELSSSNVTRNMYSFILGERESLGN